MVKIDFFLIFAGRKFVDENNIAGTSQRRKRGKNFFFISTLIIKKISSKFNKKTNHGIVA
jgi:hypothetical protein